MLTSGGKCIWLDRGQEMLNLDMRRETGQNVSANYENHVAEAMARLPKITADKKAAHTCREHSGTNPNQYFNESTMEDDETYLSVYLAIRQMNIGGHGNIFLMADSIDGIAAGELADPTILQNPLGDALTADSLFFFSLGIKIRD